MGEGGFVLGLKRKSQEMSQDFWQTLTFVVTCKFLENFLLFLRQSQPWCKEFSDEGTEIRLAGNYKFKNVHPLTDG